MRAAYGCRAKRGSIRKNGGTSSAAGQRAQARGMLKGDGAAISQEALSHSATPCDE